MEQTTRVCRAEGSGALLQEEDTLEAVYRLGGVDGTRADKIQFIC